MTGQDPLLLPCPDGCLHLWQAARCPQAFQQAAVAAQDVGLQHGVDVAEAAGAGVVERKLAHRDRIVGVDFDQRGEDSFVAGGLVPGHHRPAHLRVGPTVEALRRVLLPVDERPATAVYALDDRAKSGSGLGNQGFVVEHVAQPHQAVEPVAALFQRPAGTVGLGLSGLDLEGAFPGVVEAGMILVQVPGDAVGCCQGPIAEPARRRNGPGRQRAERRRDGQLARLLTPGRLGAARGARQNQQQAAGNPASQFVAIIGRPPVEYGTSIPRLVVVRSRTRPTPFSRKEGDLSAQGPVPTGSTS